VRVEPGTCNSHPVPTPHSGNNASVKWGSGRYIVFCGSVPPGRIYPEKSGSSNFIDPPVSPFGPPPTPSGDSGILPEKCETGTLILRRRIDAEGRCCCVRDYAGGSGRYKIRTDLEKCRANDVRRSLDEIAPPARSIGLERNPINEAGITTYRRGVVFSCPW